MNGRDQEALPEGREASRGLPGGLDGICRPIRRAVRSRELVRRPSRMAVRGWKDFWRCRRDREAIPKGQERS